MDPAVPPPDPLADTGRRARRRARLREPPQRDVRRLESARAPARRAPAPDPIDRGPALGRSGVRGVPGIPRRLHPGDANVARVLAPLRLPAPFRRPQLSRTDDPAAVAP